MKIGVHLQELEREKKDRWKDKLNEFLKMRWLEVNNNLNINE